MKCFIVFGLLLCCSLASAQNNMFWFPDQDYVDQQNPAPRAPTVRPTAAPTVPTVTNAPTAAPATPTTPTAPMTPTTASPAYLDCLASCPTTNEYNPVCGSDQVSYQNRQRLSCANQCGPRVNQQWTPVVIAWRGMCVLPGR